MYGAARTLLSHMDPRRVKLPSIVSSSARFVRSLMSLFRVFFIKLKFSRCLDQGSNDLKSCIDQCRVPLSELAKPAFDGLRSCGQFFVGQGNEHVLLLFGWPGNKDFVLCHVGETGVLENLHVEDIVPLESLAFHVDVLLDVGFQERMEFSEFLAYTPGVSETILALIGLSEPAIPSFRSRCTTKIYLCDLLSKMASSTHRTSSLGRSSCSP